MKRQQNSSSDTGFMQRPTNSSSDTVLMQIAYTDTMGVRKIVEKEVKISNTASTTGTMSFQGQRNAAQQNSVTSNYTWYLLGLIVVVGGFVLQRKYTSRKMLDPDFKIKDIFKSPKK